ncbi:Hypothetical protein LUCI_0848 [Lucifera butyrica]|uniref:Uncharacterized protein n=2 Tax=Lucifera butyrica TaxID=1351585 RepID=A0A498R927_9FIRM|nr:Hypothetical protein LUCI_0848 [Lucifera butyrica]
MAQIYSHEGYCDLADKEKKNSNKFLGIGIYAVYMLLAAAATWYTISHQIYIDPTVLQ